MSTMTLTVSSSVVQVVTPYTKTKTLIINNGPDALYISDDNSVTVANGFPVANGATLSWPRGQGMYAVSGGTSVLVAIPTDANYSV